MSDRFYSDAQLHDRLFPSGEAGVEFYRAQAERQGGRVLELGSGTGRKLLPIAADGHPCTGLELSAQMLAEARRQAEGRGLAVEWVQGDMRDFDLGRTFDLVVIAGNSLLHLRETADLLSCLRLVHAHLAPGGRLILDVFNPDPRLLAETYDAAAQVTRGTWYFSADSQPDFLVVPLALRSLFPQELPLLLALCGLRLVERLGDWSGRPFTVDAPTQLCMCEAV